MIQVLSNKTSNRLQYTLDFIFGEVFKENVQVINQAEACLPDCSLLLVYGKSSEKIPSGVPTYVIPSHPLLFEEDIKILRLDVRIADNGLPYFFERSENPQPDIPFDIFSFVFYLITRYEEYVSTKKDGFGRYPASASFAFQHQCLKRPLVDQWLYFFAESMFNKAGVSLSRSSTFGVYPTIDIDKVWAFAYPGNSGWKGWVKDLVMARFSSIQDRIQSLKNPQKDPFFTFETLQKHLKKSKKTPFYFILYAKTPGGYDINHSRDLLAFQNWLKSFFMDKETGLHPSWLSNSSAHILEEEKSALSACLKKEIRSSRQHFIKLTLPNTYQNLLTIGITDDFSMGYPDALGFRASTGHSFYWFDLTKNEKTALRLHPFQIMDVTLKKYEGLSPDQAIETCKQMISEAERTQTPIRFIWHNSSFYPAYVWKNWENVFSFLCENENFS